MYNNCKFMINIVKNRGLLLQSSVSKARFILFRLFVPFGSSFPFLQKRLPGELP